MNRNTGNTTFFSLSLKEDVFKPITDDLKNNLNKEGLTTKKLLVYFTKFALNKKEWIVAFKDVYRSLDDETIIAKRIRRATTITVDTYYPLEVKEILDNLATDLDDALVCEKKFSILGNHFVRWCLLDALKVSDFEKFLNENRLHIYRGVL